MLILTDSGCNCCGMCVRGGKTADPPRRYLSRLPFIITNLALAELKDPKDITHACIYDRILERCAPVHFSGRNYRTENAENTKNAIRDIFTQEDSP